MASLCFDYGHGGSDGGACYKGRKESNDVLALGKEVASEMRRHNITVDETRTNDSTVSLGARSSFENRKAYNYFISFHRNAFQPEKAQGVEVYTYLNGSAKAKSLANKVQANLVALGFVNRKVKEANFHVLRETKCTSILIETGFEDNTNDNNLFDSKRNEIIKAITKAILSQLGITYKEVGKVATLTPVKVKSNLFKVQVGAFGVKSNADDLKKELEKLGYKPFIKEE
ncbi:N-acetylmuramoyl-L-alanine amidase [Clostridium lacusfryxellense]|uniref:N-acetylmuramoyl-L-alanine amidase n=1 Tax=Clostridium lacusfryxellense TaxID=205328 RepID=UPI001C0CC287|nr:N-acetylmuramoyl-L-alanine amidase [Clostridium lacusfryxellense]MBU3112116.1 N-acetylmuramoyl-L-alanine amidase [Clostridium lacusfryxellense]